MGALDGFSARVRQRMSTAQTARAAQLDTVEEAMRVRLEAAARLRAAGEPIQRGVVAPRMEVLASQLAGVSLDHLVLPAGLSSVVHRAHSPLFPALARLSVGVAWAEDTGQMWLASDQAFTPVLLPLDRTTRLELDPAEPDEAAVGAWVEMRIIEFVDACIEVECSPAYRGAEQHLDPVCGMVVTTISAVAVLERDGRRYHFCSTACRERFEAEADAFTRQRRAGRAP